MHAISSYRGNRPTNTETDRTDYTAPLSLARSVKVPKVIGVGDLPEADLLLMTACRN